ncbi:hypothetical protein [Streptomyces flavidovirens]|uniref:Uncharacterized protein n=1 Tax=Streptomyces flavidovirens TaxID=67298 RepID=A0ABW6RQ39_9ACTN
MYEMRAELVPAQGALVWHVVSKETRAGALCGYLIPPQSPSDPAASGEAAEERYCSSCMSAVGSAVARHLRRPAAT